MKKILTLISSAACGLAMLSCAGGYVPEAGTPVFGDFTYTGADAVYEQNPLGKDEFYTPILQGCYPDPSICRKGEQSSAAFAINPGRAHLPLEGSGQLAADRPRTGPSLAAQGRGYGHQRRNLRPNHTLQPA